jgi:glycosyltransferase involved in cell wall biosynthesis
MKRGGMLPGGIALARTVREFRPDLIHFHSETPEACGAVMAQFSGYGRRVPLVRTIHNSVVWRYWPRIGRWCDRRLAHAAIACVSEAACEEFRRYRHDSGAHPPPFEPCVIYNGVSTPVREPAGLRDATVRRVLFAGRFEPQKGTDMLCAAIPLVQLPQGVKGELTFVGHGAHQSLVDALAETPPPGWTITVQPPVAKLADHFPHFDLVVMPSRFEGLGLVAIEATLAGVPVVATDAPGLREALPADYPWRAAPGEASAFARSLSAACDTAARWREIVRSAQQFALARFSPAAMGAGYRQVYERLRARAEFAR